MPAPYLNNLNAPKENPEEICLFAQTNFRNQMRKFGIKVDDRRRHMYVIGKTGMGKTTLMENMVLSDIYKGHGVGVVDPHGDFAEKIINFIPSNRINDVVYFNPGDIDNPIGFNILEVNTEEQKHLIAAGLMGIFKKIWPDVWSSRMEYILNNTILALLDYPGSTLLGINRLLADKVYRRKVVKQLTDPVVKAFWQTEFAGYNDRYAQEAVAPIQNKIGQFLSASVIRNMVAQVKSTINVREIMDNRKIFIMNLSKGRIGEDNSRLLGGMLITKLQLAAMERVDTPEQDRQDFFLYVDEFQNFATPSFANILSEARKYRLSLIMAHQYVAQLDELVSDAVFGNVGTIVSFRVGGADSELLAKEFAPVFLEEDVVNLAKFNVIMKLMIDGVASQPFTAVSMPPIGSPTDSAEKVIRVSRERYAKKRSIIEEKILRWSGMGELDEEEGEGDGDSDEESNGKFEEPREKIESAEKKTTTSHALPPKREEKKFEEPVEQTPTLSLKDLLPKDSSDTYVFPGEKKIDNKIQSSPLVKDSQTNIQSPVKPPLAFAQPRVQQVAPTGQFASLSGQNEAGQPGLPGTGKKRKRKRKKKSGQGGGTPPFGTSTQTGSQPTNQFSSPNIQSKPSVPQQTQVDAKQEIPPLKPAFNPSQSSYEPNVQIPLVKRDESPKPQTPEPTVQPQPLPQESAKPQSLKPNQVIKFDDGKPDDKKKNDDDWWDIDPKER